MIVLPHYLPHYVQAQAQELVCDSVHVGSEHIDHAHKAKCVADCYAPVREFMERSEVKGYLPDCWVMLVKVGHLVVGTYLYILYISYSG